MKTIAFMTKILILSLMLLFSVNNQATTIDYKDFTLCKLSPDEKMGILVLYAHNGVCIGNWSLLKALLVGIVLSNKEVIKKTDTYREFQEKKEYLFDGDFIDEMTYEEQKKIFNSRYQYLEIKYPNLRKFLESSLVTNYPGLKNFSSDLSEYPEFYCEDRDRDGLDFLESPDFDENVNIWSCKDNLDCLITKLISYELVRCWHSQIISMEKEKGEDDNSFHYIIPRQITNDSNHLMTKPEKGRNYLFSKSLQCIRCS